MTESSWCSRLQDAVSNLNLCPSGASPVAQMVKNLPAIREMRVQSLGQEDPLEKGMTSPSILVLRIPKTEEAGRLQSLWPQILWHDWATKHAHTHILIGMQWYLIAALICKSLMTYDVEHLLICLFSIYKSLVRCLFRSLAHCLIRLFIFLLLNCNSSLYILDISPLLDTSFENIFSQAVAYVLILLRIFTFYFTHFSIEFFLNGQIFLFFIKVFF